MFKNGCQVMLVIFSETISVIAGKRTVIWRIAIHHISRLQHRQRFIKAGADKRCSLGFFCKCAKFFFREIRIFIITVGNVEMPALVIAT